MSSGEVSAGKTVFAGMCVTLGLNVLEACSAVHLPQEQLAS